jgi:hypothetical protein
MPTFLFLLCLFVMLCGPQESLLHARRVGRGHRHHGRIHPGRTAGSDCHRRGCLAVLFHALDTGPSGSSFPTDDSTVVVAYLTPWCLLCCVLAVSTGIGPGLCSTRLKAEGSQWPKTGCTQNTKRPKRRFSLSLPHKHLHHSCLFSTPTKRAQSGCPPKGRGAANASLRTGGPMRPPLPKEASGDEPFRSNCAGHGDI